MSELNKVLEVVSIMNGEVEENWDTFVFDNYDHHRQLAIDRGWHMKNYKGKEHKELIGVLTALVKKLSYDDGGLVRNSGSILRIGDSKWRLTTNYYHGAASTGKTYEPWACMTEERNHDGETWQTRRIRIDWQSWIDGNRSPRMYCAGRPSDEYGSKYDYMFIDGEWENNRDDD